MKISLCTLKAPATCDTQQMITGCQENKIVNLCNGYLGDSPANDVTDCPYRREVMLDFAE